MKEEPWIEWSGGECPVEPRTVVDVRFRAGVSEVTVAELEDWHHLLSDPETDIIAYRIVEPIA